MLLRTSPRGDTIRSVESLKRGREKKGSEARQRLVKGSFSEEISWVGGGTGLEGVVGPRRAKGEVFLR